MVHVGVDLHKRMSQIAVLTADGELTLILTGLLFALRTRRALALENLALRHQLAVLQRAAPRPQLRRSDRVLSQ